MATRLETDWLKEDYFCEECNEFLSWAKAPHIPIDDILWLKKVLEFNELHKKHGFEL